jgi:hypothetical protein
MVGFIENLRDYLARFSAFKQPDPVRDSAGFGAFLANRAAFVAQKKLYEYVKQRMGMNYPERFRDDIFIVSLNIAKWRVYAACLSDLALFMAARVSARTGDPAEALALAGHWYRHTVFDRFDDKEMNGDLDEIVAAFADRAALANLGHMAQGEAAFQLSPKELVRWAPISDELKQYDSEIVINSLRFAWLAVRREFDEMTDAEAVMGDWRGSR